MGAGLDCVGGMWARPARMRQFSYQPDCSCPHQIVTDNYPFPEAKKTNLITIKVIAGLLPSLYEDVQLSQIGGLCYLMLQCWKSKPKERPSAAECRRAIQWVVSLRPQSQIRKILSVRGGSRPPLPGLGATGHLKSGLLLC